MSGVQGSLLILFHAVGHRLWQNINKVNNFFRTSKRSVQYGQNRKSVEGFFKNGSWNKRTGLLGKTEDKGDEFGAKKTWEVQDYLHLENNGRFCAKLWVKMVKQWGKKGSDLWGAKREQRNTKMLETINQSINQSFISGLFHCILLPDHRWQINEINQGQT